MWTSHSFDLLSQLNNPKTINKIRVGGSGWNFEGKVDNVQLICSPAEFRRGDVDGNGKFELADAISNLSFLFLGTFAPLCRKI